MQENAQKKSKLYPGHNVLMNGVIIKDKHTYFANIEIAHAKVKQSPDAIQGHLTGSFPARFHAD